MAAPWQLRLEWYRDIFHFDGLGLLSRGPSRLTATMPHGPKAHYCLAVYIRWDRAKISCLWLLRHCSVSILFRFLSSRQTLCFLFPNPKGRNCKGIRSHRNFLVGNIVAVYDTRFNLDALCSFSKASFIEPRVYCICCAITPTYELHTPKMVDYRRYLDCTVSIPESNSTY